MTLTVGAPLTDGGVVLLTGRGRERLDNVSGRDPPKKKKKTHMCDGGDGGSFRWRGRAQIKSTFVNRPAHGKPFSRGVYAGHVFLSTLRDRSCPFTQWEVCREVFLRDLTSSFLAQLFVFTYLHLIKGQSSNPLL